MMASADTTPPIAAEAYLTRLAERGIDYIFANAGTDFAPIVEALSHSPGSNRRYPKVITVPHENVAMAMAHGYYRTAGKPAVVMCHVTVGTANCINGLMNATRDNAPVILAAGRTPLTETGHKASRQRSIHWGQEAFDQGGMVRQFVKWDYEFHAGQPVEALVDRALDIAMSEPRGPVYLTLPREVLCDPAVPQRRDNVRAMLGAAAPSPSQSAIEDAARAIAGAEFPLIVTSAAGRSPAAFDALAKLAETYALPVVQAEARDVNLSSDHPMNFGFDVGPWLPKADVIVVLDAAVPWIPRQATPGRHAHIIHISSDPLLVTYPFREYEADQLITGEVHAAVTMLHAALADAMKGKSKAVEARRKMAAEARAERQERYRKLIDGAKNQMPINLAWVGACLNAAKAKDAIIISELGVPAGQLELTHQGSYIGNMLAGGLGMGLGAALGAKLAAPEREVISMVGDGSYMFGNPLPFHYVAHAENLPTLTIVTNNQSWHAVRRATLDVYPDGDAAKANIMPLTELKPSPSFEKIIEASGGGHAAKVENPADLPKALETALAAVRSGTPAILNVLTGGRA
jgi:acetolactate synthase-1/2/3 large subunit